MDSPYLSTLDSDGWMVDDGEATHRAHPDTYWIPPLEERATLDVGDWAKLRFYLMPDATDREAIVGERMWVEVLDTSTDFYRGELINHPVTACTLTYGAIVWFEPRHVIDIVRVADQDVDPEDLSAPPG